MPTSVHQLCTLAQVKDRVTMTANNDDSKITSLILTVLPTFEVRYGREFMPYVTETRIFEARSRSVSLINSDLRAATAVVLHPESEAVTLTAFDTYTLDTDRVTGTAGILRLSGSTYLSSEFARKFNYARLSVTGDWGCWDDVGSVPPDINEAAIETVLAWMNRPSTNIASIDSSDVTTTVAALPQAWDIPIAAHRKMQPYSRSIGVY